MKSYLNQKIIERVSHLLQLDFKHSYTLAVTLTNHTSSPIFLKLYQTAFLGTHLEMQGTISSFWLSISPVSVSNILLLLLSSSSSSSSSSSNQVYVCRSKSIKTKLKKINMKLKTRKTRNHSFDAIASKTNLKKE